jgi:formate dehydrogenase maturation protein FdhE
VKRTAPHPLADVAEELARSKATFQQLIDTYWDTETIDVHTFSLALLQPYTELLASRSDISFPRRHASTCPSAAKSPLQACFWGEKALNVAHLFACSIEGISAALLAQAAARKPDKLPVLHVGQFEHIRVEACDTCRTYLKSVD